MEGGTIQHHFQKSNPPKDQSQRMAKVFADLMLQGKAKSPLCFITEQDMNGVFQVCDVTMVLDVLKE